MQTITENALSFIGLACLAMFILAFGFAGVFLIRYGRKQSQQVQASQRWPSTAGRVVQSSVGMQRGRDGDTDYVPHVRYEYTAMGQAFVGDRIAVGPVRASNRRAGTEAALARYPVGGTVTVYYNPSNPQEAVLERKGATAIAFVLGIVMLAVVACLACPALVMLGSSLVGLFLR